MDAARKTSDRARRSSVAGCAGPDHRLTIVTPALRGSRRNARTVEISRSLRCSAARIRPLLLPWIRRSSERSASSASFSACSVRASASSTVSPCRSTSVGATPLRRCGRPDTRRANTRGAGSGAGDGFCLRADRSRLSSGDTAFSSTTTARPLTSTTSRPLVLTSRTTPFPSRVWTCSPVLNLDSMYPHALLSYCQPHSIVSQRLHIEGVTYSEDADSKARPCSGKAWPSRTACGSLKLLATRLKVYCSPGELVHARG